jgi:hypothetical protein
MKRVSDVLKLASSCRTVVSRGLGGTNIKLSFVNILCKIFSVDCFIPLLELIPCLFTSLYTMTPDISQLPDSGYAHGRADGYQIPDLTFRDPKNRRIKVLTIGAGVSGIMMAYQVQKQCEKLAELCPLEACLDPCRPS